MNVVRLHSKPQIEPQASNRDAPPDSVAALHSTGSLPSQIGRSAPVAETVRPASGEEPIIDQRIHAAMGQASGGFSPIGALEAWFDWSMHLAVSPGRVSELLIKGVTEAQRLGGLSVDMLTNKGSCNPCERSLPQDKRFRHESWQQWPFALYAESFLSLERWWDEATSHVHGATRHHLELVNFIGRQALDRVAPSNFVPTNPEILKRTIERRGTNLIEGAGRAYEDIRKILRHEPIETQTAFVPGKTVAMTAGRVILRTSLAEVIQYSPSTATVRPEPILIVPAWIMKYYILDLRAENSLVKYLVDEGFTVFMISWKNADESDRNVGLDDYRAKGVMPALEAALSISGARQAHAVGYCIGGTLLAATAAALARDKDSRLKTLSLLAAQTDFTEAGELKLFIDDSQLSILEDRMAERGMFEASQMAGTFHLLRSNDLIWSRLIRRYLMGEKEKITDVTAWSMDTTRLPYRMHSEYLRGFYLNNDLAEGRFQSGSGPVALQDIHVPIFLVGTEWDHVAPWRSVYKLHLLTDTELTFALTNGGHNQGIVSPPSRSDRHFRIATSRPGEQHLDPESWFAAARYCEGSWWPDWFRWLAEHSSDQTKPPPTGRPDLGLDAICAAPGTYVFG